MLKPKSFANVIGIRIPPPILLWLFDRLLSGRPVITYGLCCNGKESAAQPPLVYSAVIAAEQSKSGGIHGINIRDFVIPRSGFLSFAIA